MITPSGTNPKITERGLWNVFRACGRDDQQGTIAGAFLAKNYKDKRIAVVHDKSPAGQGLARRPARRSGLAGLRRCCMRP